MKQHVLVVSHVPPIPGRSGQHQRVRNLNLALCEHFRVSFLLPERIAAQEDLSAIEETVDHLIIASEQSGRLRPHRFSSRLHAWRTGLKTSNYMIGRIMLSPDVVDEASRELKPDVVIFHYPHAAQSVEVFRRRGTPCVLDMHDLLFRSFEATLSSSRLSGRRREARVAKYREWEQSAWSRFDGIIAISAGEYDYVVDHVSPDQTTYCAPMGLGLAEWPYIWSPSSDVRIGYYGALGSRRAVLEVERLVTRTMPTVWSRFPDAECWIIGSNPGPAVSEIARKDRRVVLTGHVEDVSSLLSTLTVVACPFAGRYGFRSRIIELLATGVPVVATSDAVSGMGLEDGAGVTLRDLDEEIAHECIRLAGSAQFARHQSLQGRALVEDQFSFEATYGRLAADLAQDVASGRLSRAND